MEIEGLSIVIPTYDVPLYLKECIESVKNQKTNFPIEILIGVDNCKNTLSYIKENKELFKKLRIFYFKNHSGPFVIKNTLTKVAKFENVLFFDSDDVMVENFLEKVFLKLKETNITQFKYVDFENHTSNIKSSETTASGVIGVKKDFFLSTNGFYNWICAADTEFEHRLSHDNVKIGIIDGISFYRRIHKNNLTIKKETNNRSDLRKKYIEIINKKIKDNMWAKPEILYIGDYRKIKL